MSNSELPGLLRPGSASSSPTPPPEPRPAAGWDSPCKASNIQFLVVLIVCSLMMTLCMIPWLWVGPPRLFRKLCRKR